MATATWWFVRHGESEANAGQWIGRDDPLTERGRQQAASLRERLAELRPARVVSSDLQRAHHTAQLTWQDRQPAIEVHPALRERTLGVWEGCSRAALREAGHMATLLSWDEGPEGGESQRTLSRRVLTWLAVQPDAVDTLVFAHGGVIRCLAGLLDGTDRDTIGRIRIDNVQCVERHVPPGTWQRLLHSL